MYPSNMLHRTNYSSGDVWEDMVGYSRAVKLGNHIEVSGTVAADENGHVVGRDDAYQQTVFILQKIERALKGAGASLKDVVRTRMLPPPRSQTPVDRPRPEESTKN